MTRKLSLLAVVFLAMGLLFTACPVQFDPDDFIVGEVVVPPDFTGYLTGIGEGHYGDVRVTLFFEYGVIVDVTFEHIDSPGYWQYAEAAAREAFENNSFEVDVVAGATNSSRGIIQAVMDILNQIRAM